MSRSIGSIVVGLAIAGGLVGLKFYGKSQAGGEIGHEVHAILERCEGYAQNKAYMDHLCDSAHAKAFDHAYTMGGRRSSAKFDDDKYIHEWFDTMIAQANADKSTHIAKAITKLRDDFFAGNVGGPK